MSTRYTTDELRQIAQDDDQTEEARQMATDLLHDAGEYVNETGRVAAESNVLEEVPFPAEAGQ